MQLKWKKGFVEFMEKVLWLIECVKSGLWLLVLENSCWKLLQSHRTVEVDSDQIETSIENNQHYTAWEIADILKIPKSIKLLVEMENVSFILWKKPYRLWPTQYFKGYYHCIVTQRTDSAKLQKSNKWINTFILWACFQYGLNFLVTPLKRIFFLKFLLIF